MITLIIVDVTYISNSLLILANLVILAIISYFYITLLRDMEKIYIGGTE